jgi:hypothetical protein
MAKAEPSAAQAEAAPAQVRQATTAMMTALAT